MRILFQGDSITDAGRTKTSIAEAGIGYVNLIQSQLCFEKPQEFEILNRGISGNRIIDVYARIQNQIIELKPDILSVLVGVNDVLSWLSEIPNGIGKEKFYKIYSMLIEEVKSALPDIKIILMEPFVLEGTATEANWQWTRKEMEAYALITKQAAEENKLAFVPLQDKFNDVLSYAPPGYWLYDGVHPTSAGHELIKREWIKAYNLL